MNIYLIQGWNPSMNKYTQEYYSCPVMAGRWLAHMLEGCPEEDRIGLTIETIYVTVPPKEY